MATTKLGLPTITGNMTNDVPRDLNALATAVDNKAGAVNGLATLGADGKVPSSQLNIQAPADASTTVKGIVMLDDTTSSTSTTKAATANAVKTAMDRADAAFTSASNGKASIANAAGSPSVSSDTFSKIAADISTGKTKIAQAITSKGGTATGADSWDTLVSAVGGIALGKKWANGTGNASGTATPQTLTISTLSFTPSIIVVSGTEVTSGAYITLASTDFSTSQLQDDAVISTVNVGNTTRATRTSNGFTYPLTASGSRNYFDPNGLKWWAFE